MNSDYRGEKPYILIDTITKKVQGKPVILSAYEADEKNYAYAYNRNPLRYQLSPSPGKSKD